MSGRSAGFADRGNVIDHAGGRVDLRHQDRFDAAALISLQSILKFLGTHGAARTSFQNLDLDPHAASILPPAHGDATAFQNQDFVALGQHVGQRGFPGAVTVRDIDIRAALGAEHLRDIAMQAVCQSQQRAAGLRKRFDRIFLCRTGFATLDRLLARLHANKDELLMVLDRPEIPLHTNGSENDIRCQVTRRKISAGTRSDIGRECRDAFLSLATTCDKLGIAIWDYLGSRLKVAAHAIIAPLDQYVRARLRPA